MKKLITTVAALCMAATLTACGGGGGSTAQVAASDSTVAMNATTGPTVASSVAAKAFTFSSGVPDLGTTGSTTVTFPTASSFSVASGGNTASGSLSFGSCHFNVSNSTFTSGPLVNGNSVTITNCQLLVATKGLPADGSQHTEAVQLVLDGATSATVTVTVTVLSNGGIVVNSVTVGTATLTPVTGA